MKLFIHTNHKQYLVAKIAEYSFRKMSRHNEVFDVEITQLKDHPALWKRDGRPYLREGARTVWRNDDLQSFTPLRFLPPQLMGYKGRAVVTDPDVFALTDVFDLLSMDMEEKAILCKKVHPKDGGAAYYASSVMLLDCAKLTHWRWEENISEMFEFKRDYRRWMGLLTEQEETLGCLDETWNCFDRLDETTKLLHNTGRITQPWKTGLPIDFMPKRRPVMETKKWGLDPRSWIRRLKSLIKGKSCSAQGFYVRHPDPKQEKFFFSLFSECLEKGIINEKEVQQEILKKHLRPDIFEMLEIKESATL